MGGDGADGNDDGFGRLRDRKHVAAAVEKGSGFHDEAGRENFASDDRFGLNFDFALGANRAVETAGDDYVVPFDFTFDAGVLAED